MPDEIAPVERPIQFDAPEISFLPDVERFLMVSQARQAFDVTGKGLTVAVLETGQLPEVDELST